MAVPATPGGIALARFGDAVMKWGRGDQAALDRIQTTTADELTRGGVTRQMALEWARFYFNEALRNPGNPSAWGRAQLMQHAADLLIK